MTRPGRSREVVRLALVACALALTPACHTRHDQFYGQVFTCDPAAAQDPCGTTAAGKPMTCFSGSQLGGSNFCVEACDPARGSPDVNHMCVMSGALLQVCHPNSEASDPSQGCPTGLQCYRTDLLTNQGVCLMMRVCTQDSDCSGDPARRICAGTLVRGITSLSAVRSDHLQCLQATCRSGGSLCKDGESCLGNFLDTEHPELPDICVPNCDSNLHCPPNYACSTSLMAPGSPPICLPGLAGTRCVADQDCAIGQCTDTGGGLSECVVPLPCGSDFDCAPFDGPGLTFLCVEGIPGADRRCVALTPFYGGACNDDSQCPQDQRCFRYSPYTGSDPLHGQCRVPCDGGQPCAARGGIPHVCLANGDGGCFPTNAGLPCTSSSECAASLACTAVTPDEHSVIVSPSICTTTCTTDDDCIGHPLIYWGFCKEGLCRLPGQKGAPCDRPAQCVGHRCDVAGTGQCAQ